MAKKRLNALQKAWIEKLKSGKTKKTTDILSDPKGYCCLGVACTILGIAKKEMKGRSDLDDFPQGVDKLRLRGSIGQLLNNLQDGKGSLAEMNDSGWSHRKIGEYIEKNPENVFT